MTSSWTHNVFDSFTNLLINLTHGSLRYLFAFFGAFALSLLLTPMARALARRLGMVDMPGERRINKTPIPRGGGIAVFIAFHLMLLFFTLYGGVSNISQRFSIEWQWHFFLASSLLLVIGFVDDKFGMRPFLKLAGQVAVASILFVCDVRIEGVIVPFPGWLAYIVTVVWIVGAINAFNLIDGMDGLSSGLSLIAAIGLAGSLVFKGQTADTIPFLVLAGACLGFLRYNFHPASVFLGDSGSMFLGLCIATLPLMTGSRRELIASLGVPLLAMGIPIFDTMLAIWRRTARAMLNKGRQASDETQQQTRIMQPDKEHLHHRILMRTLNQRRAAIILYLAAAVLVSIGLIGMLFRNHAGGIYMIAFVVAVFVGVRHMIRIELWDTGRLLSRKRAPLRQAVILPLYIVTDVVILLFAWITARFFAGLAVDRQAFMYNLPVVAGIFFVALVVSRTYMRVWSRATIRDYVVLTVTLLIASVFSVGVMFLTENDTSGFVMFMFVMFMSAFFPIVGVRVLRECVNGIVHVIERMVIMDKPGVDLVIVIGGGVKFSLFLRELISRAGENKTVIAGLLDEDINLHGRIIAGYRVLGGLDMLSTLVSNTGAQRVLITCEMEDEKLEAVAAMLKDAEVELCRWCISEASV